MDQAFKLILASSLEVESRILSSCHAHTFMSRVGSQFPSVLVSPFSRVSHTNFFNPSHLDLISLLYFLIDRVLMNLSSGWDLPNQGFKWLSRSVTLFLPVKSVISSGTHPSDVGGLFGNLYLKSS